MYRFLPICMQGVAVLLFGPRTGSRRDTAGSGLRPGEYIEKKLDPIIRNDFKAISLDFDEE
jgi:hypothetical protein